VSAFLLAVGVVFVAAAACGSVAARLRLPRVVGEMAAGLVLGRSVLGHAWPRAESYLFGGGVLGSLRDLGLLCVLLYIALVGAELDRSALRGRRGNLTGAVLVGVAAAAGGAAVIGTALSSLEPRGVPRWTFFAFLTAALLVTAVPVLARILDEAGLTSTRVGGVTLSLSVADDFVAFSAVAVAIAAATHGSLALAAGGTVALAALALLLKAAKPISSLRGLKAVSLVGIGLLALAGGAINAMGASTLVAAFLVGALVWRPGSPGEPVAGASVIRVLVPLYIVYTGLSVDLGRLGHRDVAFGIFVVTVFAVGTKALACFVAGPLFSLDRNETISLAVLRNTRGLTELVALNLGFQAGLLSADLYTLFFGMALLTTAVSGVLAMTVLKRLGPATAATLETPLGAAAP
jgi:Kef-type K+ transport system membrane component KefB